MTAILAWFNQEPGVDPYIIAVGDSKITGDKGATLEGAKIFALPIKVKDITSVSQEAYFTGTIGCAIAGSTLVGFNVYSFLQTAFSNLGGSKARNDLPDYNSLCAKAEQSLRLYVPAIRSGAEIMLFGFCPQTKIPFIGTMLTIQNEEGEITYSTIIKDAFDMDVEIVNLGAHKGEISDLVNIELEKNRNIESIWHWRKPAKVLKEIIRNNQFESIGGNLQINLCFPTQFDSYSLIIPTTENRATLKFRNIDYSEDIMGNIGQCVIALGGYPVEERQSH